jgi:CheY-like chemotaxis protein
MMDTQTEGLPDDLVNEARELLAHYYDHAYLARHPMLERLRPVLGDNSAAAVRALRRMLLEMVERLRPRGAVPQADPAWRPYAVIQKRYILCKELSDLEQELNLGVRQIQREQRRGLQVIAAALLEKRSPEPPEDAEPFEGDALWREIALAAGEQEVLDVGRMLRAACSAVQPLAQSHDVVLDVASLSVGLVIHGIPSLFRQLVVGALSLAIRHPGVESVSLGARRQGRSVVCTLHLRAADPKLASRPIALPETLLSLARAQSAQVTRENVPDGWVIALRFAALAEPCTVVLVEDNTDMVALFARYLAREGYRLVSVTDSTLALERMLESQPDAVVLDVMMRDLDGWELLQRIKAEPRLAKVPLVICSVLDEAELAASLGADAYLRKPIRPAELLECLSSLCR